MSNLIGMSLRRAVLPASWSVWSHTRADGPRNMATDVALMAAASPETGVWRWYGWATPTISFGRNERVEGRFSAASIAEAGLAAVRRPTGGRALLHAREVTYSVTWELHEDLGWRDAYDAINGILCGALQDLGIPVIRAGVQPPVVPDGPVCFDMPAQGELVVRGRKLVGSAVWRQGKRYLQHGSILLQDDQALLSRAAIHPLPAIPATATLREFLPTHDETQTAAVLSAAVRQRLETVHPAALVTDFTPHASLLDDIGTREAAFLDHNRLWRR